MYVKELTIRRVIYERVLLVVFLFCHRMPDLGSQLHCTLYTFIVLGKIVYSNIFYGIVFYCIVVLLCSNILVYSAAFRD